jgi:hypothetical protein
VIPGFRPSFRQLLLAAFVLVALVLGGLALRGQLVLESLLERSREGAERSQALAGSAERLAELALAMERAARQYLVLGDGTLRESYQRSAAEATSQVEMLAAAGLHAPAVLASDAGHGFVLLAHLVSQLYLPVLQGASATEADRLMRFNVVVANPPFSLDKWGAAEAQADRYNRFWRGLPPKSKGDYAFITHMIETAQPQVGRVAVVVPHGVLFRGGAEERIRTKLLKDGHIDTIIGLPSNLFFSTGIPVCILVLKKCKKPDDVLFINAAENFEKGKRQNQLKPEHIQKIIDAYQNRSEEPRYSRRVPMAEIEKNDYNLNISRYISTAQAEE